MTLESHHDRDDSGIAEQPDNNLGANTVGKFTEGDWSKVSTMNGAKDGASTVAFKLEPDGSITFHSFGSGDGGKNQHGAGSSASSNGDAGPKGGASSSGSDNVQTASTDVYNTREGSALTSGKNDDGTTFTGNGHGFRQITFQPDPTNPSQTIVPGHTFADDKMVK
jgi:hypothetical protein